MHRPHECLGDQQRQPNAGGDRPMRAGLRAHARVNCTDSDCGPRWTLRGCPGKSESMEAQRLLEVAPFGAETVKVLKRALDEAWASISLTIPPDRVDDTRLSLAHAIVAHAGSGDTDYETLKAAALEAVQKHPPQSPA